MGRGESGGFELFRLFNVFFFTLFELGLANEII